MKSFLLFLIASILGSGPNLVMASDHDDGEMDRKGRALNITDVYAFREDNQTGESANSGNLILVMNTNPRSLPGQQYFFSSQARYTFHLTRVLGADVAKRPTGADDISMTFSFSEPNASGQQAMTLLFNDGSSTTANKTSNGNSILTTPLASSKAVPPALAINEITVNGKQVTVFAGLREDPFFFDVEQFFKVRAHAVATFAVGGTPQFLKFLPADKAKDFTHNYNVNTIVVRVPIALLQKNSNETVFDVWTTLSVPR